MNRDAFHAERKTGLGGSDLGAILGLSKWRTPYQVWAEKTGRAQPQESNLAMRFGSMAEQFVADEYTALTGRRTQRFNTMLRHKDAPIIGHLDRLVIPEGKQWASHKNSVTTDRLLECKTAHALALANGDWGDPGTDLVPQDYLVQVAAYMALSGCSTADLACLFGNQELRVYTIARDEALEGLLLQQAREWWQRHVVADIPPDPSTTDECRRIWPAHQAGKSLIVDVEVADHVLELANLKAQIKRLEKDADDIETKVLSAFGEAEEITYQGRRLATWRQNRTSISVDWRDLAYALNYQLDTFGHGYNSLDDYAKESNHIITRPGARVLRLANQKGEK